MRALCHATPNSGSIGRMRALCVFLVVAVTACPGLVGESQTDSGTRPDGGVALNDSGTAVTDAGMAAIDAGMPGPLDAGPLLDAGTIAALDFRFELATPEQIGLYLPVTGAVAAQSKVTVRSKVAGSSAWQVAHPLLRIDPAIVASGAPVTPVDAFAGTIFDLQPGTLYDVEVTLVQPGLPNQVQIQRTSTRALPAVTGATTVTASPGDALQAKFDALTPGAVLELADGTYEVSGLFLDKAGTERQPIVIRGHSRAGTKLHAAAGRVIQLQHASHVIFERMTLQGTGTDSGTNSSSGAVAFWDGAFQEDVVFRDLDITGVDMGIIAYGPANRVMVYNCTLTGNNVWTEPFLKSNLTWNDDAIRLPGQGNVAFENTLRGFGDSFAVNDGVMSAAIYYYRNRILMTGDDSFEADYGTRNMGFYDNGITNCATFLSLDPLWGGPLYAFRNVVVNTFRGPFKLNNTNSGFLIYNNTIVRTEGTTGWGWVQFNNGSLKAWSYRNNILLYRGAGNLLAIESTGNAPIDFTHNAWFPDKAVWWSSSGGSFNSLSLAAAGLPATVPLFSASTKRHENDVIAEQDPFVTAVTLGADYLTEFTADPVLTLRAGTAAKGTGVELPNITNGHAGAAPDMGAVIEGRPQPRWGALRP